MRVCMYIYIYIYCSRQPVSQVRVDSRAWELRFDVFAAVLTEHIRGKKTAWRMQCRESLPGSAHAKSQDRHMSKQTPLMKASFDRSTGITISVIHNCVVLCSTQIYTCCWSSSSDPAY